MVMPTTMMMTTTRMTSSSGTASADVAQRRTRQLRMSWLLVGLPSALAAAAVLSLAGMIGSRSLRRKPGRLGIEVVCVALPPKLPATAAVSAYRGAEGPLTVHTLQAAAWRDASAVEGMLLGLHGGVGAVVGLDAEWPPANRGHQAQSR